jgi:hypothetical protein
MKRIGTAALAVGMTLALATVASAQTGRDTPQSSPGMEKGTMDQKGGSMGQKDGTMQKGSSGAMKNDSMQKGSSGTMSK